MENQDLGSQKINNKQISTDLIPVNDENTASAMNSEMEVDKNGVKKIVERVRNIDHINNVVQATADKRLSTKPSLALEEIGKKMVENQDLNSDITAHRYPNSSSENSK
ncbi:MAG: hypothetical protein O9267_05475 [Flavobacterium sp.]|uniref:hypothetical protein n=1 Tax=Flavobacterium sp. TaxID=239 RepID=UPI0022BAA1F0|nr:hypothetical protein [Flavobacterium sp.]MCZ8197034.1 hypothetical protein [Flavobacterium sp.]